MKKGLVVFFVMLASALVLGGCFNRKYIPLAQANLAAEANKNIITDTLDFFDAARQRKIPVIFYRSVGAAKQPVVIINHGYNGIKLYSYGAYAYIANNLAQHGYFVVSIQHDLHDDDPMPAKGDVQQTRKAFWERGAQNILFVINQLKARYTNLDMGNVTLIGHSNGGDMVMLFAQQHAEMIKNVISLDNRRVAFPRTDRPQIFSIRSSDQKPDAGVIPGEAEQTRFNIKVVKLKHTAHNDMSDNGSTKQKAEINGYIMDFLNIKP